MDQSAQSTDLLFDATARSIIKTRRPIVQTHLARWRATPAASAIDGELAQQDWLIQLERAVCHTSAQDLDERSRGRDRWLDEFLLPLTRDLDFVQAAETITLAQLHRTGSFDVLDLTTGKYQRPPVDQIIESARSLLSSIPHHSHRVSQLVARQLCRDKETASLVVEAWRRCEQRAAGLARGVVLSYLAHEDVGLLASSAYPYTDELLLLRSHRERIAELSAPETWTQLHHDVVALASAWEVAVPEGWNIRLLKEPRNSEYRKRAAQNFGTRRRATTAQALVEQEGYSLTEAQKLVEYTLHEGLGGLIAYRSGSDDHARVVERYEQRHLRRILRDNYAALTEDDRAYIETLVLHLSVAIRRSGVPFPLMRLLTEHPSSPWRIRTSRRFHFGLAAIIKRRQQKRTLRQPGRFRRFSPGSARQPKPATVLIKAFAKISNLEEREVSALLRDLITYGAFGLLPRGQRMRCLDPRLYSWLRLIKYGRLDGRVPWTRLMTQLDAYRRMLGLPNPISPLLARAIFNAIPRPSFWHGGQGEATTRLRQRGTLAINRASRIHECWIIIAIASPVTLCDALGQAMSNSSHLVLVIEANGLLPLAAWPSAQAPTVREVCLALYQAIWHPGAENWPVKGIPEQLIVSSELMVGDRDDLDRAADYLLCDVLVQPRVKLISPELRTLLRKFERGGIETAVTHLALDERAPSRVMRSLEQWIKDQFFPYHRASPVWPEIAQHGVVMPGHDTPAAGWLLPKTGDARISADGLEHEGRYYRKPQDAALLAGGAHIRRFPALTAGGIVSGIFVQPLPGGTGPTLEYVSEQRVG